MIEIIDKYFPDLSAEQRERFAQMPELYAFWNQRINVVSRKDIESLCERHILHSLAIAKVCSFYPGARIMDVGTGGGFPGIPLAVMFPEARFRLVDSIGKKITVVKEVAAALGIENVEAVNARAESLPGKVDYVLGRAVTDMSAFIGWVWKSIERGTKAGSLPSGILSLKGGDLDVEMKATAKRYKIYDIDSFFEEEFFTTKKVVYIPKQ